MRLKFGSTRTVILIGKLAIKIPNLRRWKMFLLGILGNINEKEWRNFNDYSSLNAKGKLCPIYFCSWYGLFLIMPRCKELTEEEYFTNEQYEEFTGSKEIEIVLSDGTHYKFNRGGLPVEWKPDSFGKLNNSIVAIDYGS